VAFFLFVLKLDFLRVRDLSFEFWLCPVGTEFESNTTYTNDHELIPDAMSREPTSDLGSRSTV